MSHLIDIASVEDNRMLVDSLRARATEFRDMRRKAVTSAVDELLRARRGPVDVVLLDAVLRAEPDSAGNVRRLIDAGHRVPAGDRSAAPISAARAPSPPALMAISLATYTKGGTRRTCATRLAGGT